MSSRRQQLWPWEEGASVGEVSKRGAPLLRLTASESPPSRAHHRGCTLVPVAVGVGSYRVGPATQGARYTVSEATSEATRAVSTASDSTAAFGGSALVPHKHHDDDEVASVADKSSLLSALPSLLFPPKRARGGCSLLLPSFPPSASEEPPFWGAFGGNDDPLPPAAKRGREETGERVTWHSGPDGSWVATHEAVRTEQLAVPYAAPLLRHGHPHAGGWFGHDDEAPGYAARGRWPQQAAFQHEE